MRVILAALFLALASPALAAPKSHAPAHHTLSSQEQLKKMQFQTDTLNDYFLHRITRVVLIQRLIQGKLVVLGSTPNPSGRLFNIQNYIRNGQSFIPLFSDPFIARHLLAGARAKPGMTLWTMGGKVLLSRFQSNEWVIINAGAANMVEFHANEFRPYLHNSYSPP